MRSCCIADTKLSTVRFDFDSFSPIFNLISDNLIRKYCINNIKNYTFPLVGHWTPGQTRGESKGRAEPRAPIPTGCRIHRELRTTSCSDDLQQFSTVLILCSIESVYSSVPMFIKILKNSRWFRNHLEFFRIFMNIGTGLSTLSMEHSISTVLMYTRLLCLNPPEIMDTLVTVVMKSKEKISQWFRRRPAVGSRRSPSIVRRRRNKSSPSFQNFHDKGEEGVLTFVVQVYKFDWIKFYVEITDHWCTFELLLNPKQVTCNEMLLASTFSAQQIRLSFVNFTTQCVFVASFELLKSLPTFNVHNRCNLNRLNIQSCSQLYFCSYAKCLVGAPKWTRQRCSRSDQLVVWLSRWFCS